MKEKTRKQWFVLQHVQVKCLGNAILALGFSSTFSSKHSNIVLNLKLGNRFSEAIFFIVICMKKKFLSVVILLDFHLIIYRSWTANLVRGKWPVKTNVKNKYKQKKRESTAMQKMWTAKKRTHALLHKMIKCYWSYKEKPDNHLFLITLYCIEINDLNIHGTHHCYYFIFWRKEKPKYNRLCTAHINHLANHKSWNDGSHNVWKQNIQNNDNEHYLWFVIFKAMILAIFTQKGCPYCFVSTTWQWMMLGTSRKLPKKSSKLSVRHWWRNL